jgi:peptidyl-dipeptidase Dcp
LNEELFHEFRGGNSMPSRPVVRRCLPIFLLISLSLPLAAQDNPFLQSYGTPLNTPPFDRIKLAHYLPAIREGIKQQEAEISAIVNSPAPVTFQNTMEAMDSSGQLLSRVTRVFYQMQSTDTNKEMQNLAHELAPILSAHNDNISMNPKLFARIKNIYDQRLNLQLTPEQLYLLENTYRSFVRGGALLSDQQKARLREINSEHNVLVLKFSDNLLAETNDSYIVFEDKADLKGLPESVVAMGQDAAKERNMPGKWVYTTQRPSWEPFLQYASNRRFRQALYTAYFMRGDRDNDKDNKAILQKIMTLREERCTMLGYATPADFYLENRMAGNLNQVKSFLMRMWTPALNRAKGEAAEMQAIIDQEKGGFKLASWDWWYYAEKLRKAKYDLNDSVLRPYFKLENVQKGIFTLAQKLYGVHISERKDIPVYHPEVKAYEVKESDGTLLGIFYTDFFPRESKQGGAWSGSFRDAYYEKSTRVIPFATLVCNFTKPTGSTPSLLSVDEALTFFHEFGHTINTIFSNGHYRASFAPQDSVELPSQIMENWALEPELLKLYATHFQTGEVIPPALVEKIRKSSLFNQGFDTTEYIAASWLDLAWHSLPNAANVNITRFEEKAMSDLGLIPEILSRYRSTYFAHIHGGYEAGYYSYLFCGVLDSDAFEAFKETSLFDQKTATAFRKNILEKLGTEDTAKLYRQFRGRDPKEEPLLKKRGLLPE